MIHKYPKGDMYVNRNITPYKDKDKAEEGISMLVKNTVYNKLKQTNKNYRFQLAAG